MTRRARRSITAESRLEGQLSDVSRLLTAIVGDKGLTSAMGRSALAELTQTKNVLQKSLIGLREGKRFLR